MKKISLTDFVDVVSKSGASKATKVASIKNRKPYHPATDFYKGIREAMSETLEQGNDKSILDEAISRATEKRKGHYEEAAAGFKKWMGRKNIEWFEPAKETYGNQEFSVSVNPEIGATINGTPYLIKLYFKKDSLPKNHALISTHLMKSCLREDCPEDTVMAVLDVKRGKLIEYSTPHERLDAALKGELAYINSLWDEL